MKPTKTTTKTTMKKHEDKSSGTPALNSGDRIAFLSLYDNKYEIWHGGTIHKLHPNLTKKNNEGKGDGERATIASVIWDPLPEYDYIKPFTESGIFKDSLYGQEELDSWIHGKDTTFETMCYTKPSNNKQTVSMSIVLCMWPCILSLITSSSTFIHGFCLSHSIISNRREKERYV